MMRQQYDGYCSLLPPVRTNSYSSPESFHMIQKQRTTCLECNSFHNDLKIIFFFHDDEMSQRQHILLWEKRKHNRLQAGVCWSQDVIKHLLIQAKYAAHGHLFIFFKQNKRWIKSLIIMGPLGCFLSLFSEF